MRFAEFKELDKTDGEMNVELPTVKRMFDAFLNNTDKLIVRGYDPFGIQSKHTIVIEHKCKETNNTYTIKILHHNGSILNRKKYWKYVIFLQNKVKEEEGVFGDKEMEIINKKLNKLTSDFRINLSDFLSYCDYQKIILHHSLKI
ncbi:hypothetical protein BZG01_00950 [Labilibaculum manganireducens]|uniref:Uncharacterized protein n=1 Tax=Labilibaculum manganireducens TaxID=1940525 RepID=A0A2N3IGZ0_9BACT|nr:hypothetical protein [Labilibaculum manganireducens]PKQ69528.1 hypothetical protein BZG01_00950 [Labilibaculum manganireducens]